MKKLFYGLFCFFVIGFICLAFAYNSSLDKFKKLEEKGNSISISGKYKAVVVQGEAVVLILRIKNLGTKKYISISTRTWADSKGKEISGVPDVNGYVWAQNAQKDIIIYSIDSVYGEPGIYAFYPEENKIKILLKSPYTNEIVKLEGNKIIYKCYSSGTMNKYEIKKITCHL